MLDVWLEEEVKPRLKGSAFLVRYADDFVIGFSTEEDARRVMDVLPKRFGKYGLTLHSEKTRLLRFERPRNDHGGAPPESFDFLGFNHHWEKSLKGWWVIKQKTAKSRLTRALKRVAQWCRWYRHKPIIEQHRHLSYALRGLRVLRHHRELARPRPLRLRGAESLAEVAGAALSAWNELERFHQLLKRFALPPPRAIHSSLRSANP